MHFIHYTKLGTRIYTKLGTRIYTKLGTRTIQRLLRGLKWHMNLRTLQSPWKKRRKPGKRSIQKVLSMPHQVSLFDLILYIPVSNFSVMSGGVSLSKDKCVSRTQHSDFGEASTQGPSVSSQTLYHWVTVLPHQVRETFKQFWWSSPVLY